MKKKRERTGWRQNGRNPDGTPYVLLAEGLPITQEHLDTIFKYRNSAKVREAAEDKLPIIPNPEITFTPASESNSSYITFYYCGKVSVAQLNAKIAECFPGVDRNTILVLPGLGCTITTGKDLEV